MCVSQTGICRKRKVCEWQKIVKARLVAGGFEEIEIQQIDSPTCGRE